jgi:hypothetical protein
MLTSAGMQVFFEMFGELGGGVRGKMTNRKISQAIYDDDLIMDEKKQDLYSDVMHIDGHWFIVTVCEPLQLSLLFAVERESASVLGIALQGQLELLRSKGVYSHTHAHGPPEFVLVNYHKIRKRGDRCEWCWRFCTKSRCQDKED